MKSMWSHTIFHVVVSHEQIFQSFLYKPTFVIPLPHPQSK